MLYLSLGVESAFSQQQLIGTYTVSSPANLAGGCIPDSYNPYQDCPNPRFPVQMGSPLLIPAAPGSYSLIITGGSVFIGGIPCYQLPATEFPCPADATINLSVWSGDAATGYFVEVIPGTRGCCVNTSFQHKGGNIALYTRDQFAAALRAPITGSAVVQLYGSVGTPLSITTSSLPGGKVDTTYTQTLTATGGTPPYTWSIASGSLPRPLALNPSTGVITGIPTAPGTLNFTVQVTDSSGATAVQALSINIVGCQVTPSVPAWTQATGTDYDWSYFVVDPSTGNLARYPTRSSTPVSTTGQMELKNGNATYHISLTPSMNNLNGLTTLISAVPGTNAVVGPPGATSNFYLSVYSSRCETANCFPRSQNLLHLCDGTCATDYSNDISQAKTMDDYGCAVTALAMAANHVRVNLKQRDLNEFMSNTLDSTDLGGLFNPQGDVDWWKTPYYLRSKTGLRSLQFDGSLSLDDALCKANLPVTVEVTGPHGPHFVLVTGKQGTATDGSQYSVNDPGYSEQTLKDYENIYIKVSEIPASSYHRDQISDDVTGQTMTGLTHSIQVLTPPEGIYTLKVIGVEPGTYRAEVHVYSQDGSAQPDVSIPGIANIGSTASFQIQFSSVTGAVSTLTRVATFQSTLADISNSLQLALIDDAGIATAFSAKINAASDAAARGDSATASNVLNAFKNQVSAQTGKHITGFAPQVLQEDADSLICQLP